MVKIFSYRTKAAGASDKVTRAPLDKTQAAAEAKGDMANKKLQYMINIRAISSSNCPLTAQLVPWHGAKLNRQ